MAVVAVLAVGERDVAVGFFTGEHLFKSGEVNCGSSRMFAAVSTASSDGSLVIYSRQSLARSAATLGASVGVCGGVGDAC